MDINYIQEIWKQHETALEESRELNLALLKEVKIDKAKSSLRSLLYLPISTLIFYTFVLFYCLGFIINNWAIWYFAFSGMGIAIFSLLFVILSIRQLTQILSIDYGTPIVELQKNISRIKSSIVDNLRIANWIIPCFPLLNIFFFKVFWNVDIVAYMSSNMVYIYGAIFIILVIVSIFFSKLLSQRNINKKWMSWLLQGGGSQIDEALTFLDEVKEFENN